MTNYCTFWGRLILSATAKSAIRQIAFFLIMVILADVPWSRVAYWLGPEILSYKEWISSAHIWSFRKKIMYFFMAKRIDCLIILRLLILILPYISIQLVTYNSYILLKNWGLIMYFFGENDEKIIGKNKNTYK